jgi:phenylalanyl-tRNA synthetase beta subunit
MKITYKKIQEYITEPLPSIEVLREKIIFHAFEVESIDDLGNGDCELDIKVLPDRAHDAKEDRGMAREIAGLLGLSLKDPDVYEKTETIIFDIKKVSDLLGRDITVEEIKKVFDAYHYQYDISDKMVTLFVPPWRPDITHISDVCDELGRYLGYDTIPTVLPRLNTDVAHNAEYIAIMNKKQEMVDAGYHEVMTYTFTKKGDYQVAKGPKGKDFLRTDLLTGLRIAYSLNKQNEILLPNSKANIFEIGKVFKKTGEELHIAWIDAKGEHEEVLDISSNNIAKSDTLGSVEGIQFKMWSLYPFITRDIAVWVSSDEAKKDLAKMVEDFAGKNCVVPGKLFDEFTKDGRTSVAYRFVFQSYEKTLTDTEVEEIFSVLLKEIKSHKDFEIR